MSAEAASTHPPAHELLAGPPGDKAVIRAALAEARERTWLLAEPASDDELGRPACEYLSPPVWDLGHIANFEELWLVQRLLECGELHAGYNDTYNAFRHPRSERPDLRLLDREGVRAYMAEVRERSLAALDAVALAGDDCDRLTRDGFVHWMLVLHEHQHHETLLQTIQWWGPRYTPAATRPLPEPPRPAEQAWLDVPAGPFQMGTAHGPGVYDNEAPAHAVDVGDFQVARFPATNADHLRFMAEGGYEDKTLWSAGGRDWLAATDHHAPLHWHKDKEGAWQRTTPRGTAPVATVGDEILCHVTFWEAETHARWADARLPTEAEWEKACRFDPATGANVGRNPWGDAPADPSRANIDHLGWGPSRAGAYPAGRSPVGCEHVVGDVWEWTSSGFEAYPGFEAFPYREYSEVFFGGDFRVLRGGAWATRASCANGTFRNWDHPQRRQIFAGLRLARDG